MKKYTLAITTSVFMVLLIGGVVAYAIVSSGSDTPKTTRASTTPTANNQEQQLKIDNGASTTQPSASQTDLGVSNAQGQSLGLQSNTGQTSAPRTNNATNLPGPETFEQYEQYKDSESAMYADIVVGTGDEATANTTATMIYSGWLTDGTLFDQSRINEQGKIEAFSFKMGSGQVIRGWDQGIVGMKVGGKRRLIIPPSVGYGAQGQGPIPANALLVFDVELVAVQ